MKSPEKPDTALRMLDDEATERFKENISDALLLAALVFFALMAIFFHFPR